MTVNTERDLKNKEALKKAAFLAATVNKAPEDVYKRYSGPCIRLVKPI